MILDRSDAEELAFEALARVVRALEAAKDNETDLTIAILNDLAKDLARFYNRTARGA